MHVDRAFISSLASRFTLHDRRMRDQFTSGVLNSIKMVRIDRAKEWRMGPQPSATRRAEDVQRQVGASVVARTTEHTGSVTGFEAMEFYLNTIVLQVNSFLFLAGALFVWIRTPSLNTSHEHMSSEVWAHTRICCRTSLGRGFGSCWWREKEAWSGTLCKCGMHSLGKRRILVPEVGTSIELSFTTRLVTTRVLF